MGNENSHFHGRPPSEGSLCAVIKLKKISELPMEKSVISELVYIRGLPWLLSLSQQKKYRHDKSISIILRCNADSDQVKKGILPPKWSCRVTGTLRILSQEPAIEPITESTLILFQFSSFNNGFSNSYFKKSIFSEIDDVLFSAGGRIRLYYMYKWTPLVECGYLKNDEINIQIAFNTITDLTTKQPAPCKRVLSNTPDPVPTTSQLEITRGSWITLEKCSQCFSRPRLYMQENRLVCEGCSTKNANKQVEVAQNSANKLLRREMERQKNDLEAQNMYQFNAKRHFWFSFK
ncbi:unnamed protein product [Orchesella dallaii]|uniref:MATH domain-containing protein n=1 Tax=Orchesella dallaii TaxID=48710 RepID=A0ABP1R587_9HEXA